MNKKVVNSKIVTAVLLLLMVSLAFVALPNPTINTANAQTTTSTIPSNLLQYEWTQSTGDASRSFASSGPGPNSSYIKWRTQILGVASQPIAFSGKIFVSTDPVYFGVGTRSTYCLDAATGEILWKAEGKFGSITKLDNTYMMIGNNAYRISDGTLAWTGPSGFNFAGLTQLMGVGYDPTLKMFFTGSTTWYLPDASQPPTLLWNRATQTDAGRYGAETAKVYSEGILVYTTGYQYLIGVDARTGRTLWATPTKISQWIYGMSAHAGVIGFGGLDGNFYGWNLTTGELMWTYNPGSYMNQFASAVGSAYGMFFEHNQDTYVYAINATTGKLVWRTKGSGIGYSNILTIAGGKVYVQMGENQYVDFATGEPGKSEFYCLDAYTGELIWSMPFENGSPFNAQCNAYGNLYVTPTVSSYHPGKFLYSYAYPDGGIGGNDGGIGEVWCISDTPQDWAMMFNDPQHSSYGNGPTSLSLKWTATAGGGIVSSPTLVNGVAYVSSYDGRIYAFNAGTGQQIWNYSTGKIGFSSTVAVVNGKLYTGADDGNIYCLDATSGTKLWQAIAGGIAAVGNSPTITGNKVYVAGGDRNIYCFNAMDGTVVWKFNTGGTLSTTPIVADNAVFIPTSAPGANFVLFKVNATTGTQIFNVTLSNFVGGYSMYSPSVTASATYGGGMVFVRTTFRYNYAVNATTGQIVWMVDGRYNPGTPEQSTSTTQAAAMLYKYGRVYFNDYYGITCVNAFNGTELWHTFLSRENIAQGLSYSYGRIYTVNENGVLYVLDSLTGEKLSNYDFVGGGAQLHSMPVPYNGSLYVGSLDWNLYCFEEAPQAQVSGPSLATVTTLTVSPKYQTVGSEILFEGTVSAQSAGIPVVVHLTAIDPNNNFQDIATVTCDDCGFYVATWAPPVSGTYIVTAKSEGDQYFLSSSAKAAFVVLEAPAASPTAVPTAQPTVAPTSAPTTAPTASPSVVPEPEAAPSTDIYIIAAAAAVIIVVAAVAAVFLRKRK